MQALVYKSLSLEAIIWAHSLGRDKQSAPPKLCKMSYPSFVISYRQQASIFSVRRIIWRSLSRAKGFMRLQSHFSKTLCRGFKISFPMEMTEYFERLETCQIHYTISRSGRILQCSVLKNSKPASLGRWR